GGTRSDYVKNIQYDEYGSRIKVEYGNGVVSVYTYDEAMHRLINVKTQKGDSIYQNIVYSYDKVGNILTRSENGVVMSGNTVKAITHTYRYDNLYRLVEADGVIKENGNTINSYTNEFTYNDIGNILTKLQTVKVKGADDPELTYTYSYQYAGNKPHAVTGINDNLTYRYDASGNMIAVYDTAKNYNRVLYWDEDNRLKKTVDTKAGGSVTTTYEYDTRGMRIIKDGPFGKSIYVDTGFVTSSASSNSAVAIISNHVFVGNTRVASVVKHKDETQAAIYYYASDHLGSSSVLTTNTGNYHERIEYLPYGETWVEDKANASGYSTPYKFTSKELDPETGLYYHGHRYRDPRIGVWLRADPALSRYLPVDSSKNSKLPAGGVFVSVNLNLYHYGGNNPVTFVDPDGLFNIKTGEIEKGDTLRDITQQLNSKFGTNLTVLDVAKANNIKNPDKIRAGDCIALPGKNAQINFDGKYLSLTDKLYGIEFGKYPATSGNVGVTDFRLKDKGPLPPGNYIINTSEISPSGIVRNITNALGLTDWGNYRVRLHHNEGTVMYGRDNFFIHGGTVQGSNGCIDVGKYDRILFPKLLDFGGVIPVKVWYGGE
ncbi:MAG: RHS repeat-associated core domain-containing protein, partial [Spirochaetota bacterium]